MVTIEFQDGVLASYDGGRWECADAVRAQILDIETELAPPDYRPHPTLDLAREIAPRLGARLVSASDAPEAPEGVIY